MESQKAYNTQQSVEYLNNTYGIPVTKGTMEVWRSIGRGPRYRKVARWPLYDKKDLDDFAKGRVFETVDSRAAR